MIFTGKNIQFRTAEIKDAPFILQLRLQEHKTKFLSKVDISLTKQEDWLVSYKEKEQKGLEYYFLIESKLNEKLGLVRVYDLQKSSFCWGSWLIKDEAPKSTAIESALMVYQFGFDELNYKKSHFDVRKGNNRVILFHKRFGAKITREDELNYYFNYEQKDFLKIKNKYKRYLLNI
jgi:RimJ/RimL family protein N-acetyltransferase